MRHAGTQRAVYYTIIVVGFAAYLAAFPISAGIADRWLGNLVFLGIPVAILAATLLALSWLDRRVIKPRLATFRLLRGLCAGCRYSIAAISPDPDGCTVCPECGAAWKLPGPLPPNNPV